VSSLVPADQGHPTGPETTPGAAVRTVLFVHADAGLYGSGVSLLELASRLPRNRYFPLVALPSEGPLAEALRARGVRVELVSYGTLRRDLRPDRVSAMMWDTFSGARRLADLARGNGVALIHSNCTHVLAGGLAARWTGIPHLHHVRENLLPPKPLSRALARLVWSLADKVIVVSRATGEEFLGLRGPHPKVAVIYNGVDVQDMVPGPSPSEARARLGWPTQESHVGVVARLSPWKGHRVFLQAAAALHRTQAGVRFAIIGDSDTRRNERYKTELVALSRRLGIAGVVRWTGFVTPVQRWLSGLDIVVVPSVRPEPFGRSLIEAMAMERPVVATDHGGPREILAAGGGVLVPPGDPRALAAAVGDLLRDERLRKDLGRTARQQAIKRFSIAEHVRGVVSLYDRVLSGEAGQAGRQG
jgi:glycosyltransferase involved in cell wall biosynthesis